VPAPRWTVIHPGQPRPESKLLPSVGAEALPEPRPARAGRAVILNVSMVTSKNVSEDPFLSVRTVHADGPPAGHNPLTGFPQGASPRRVHGGHNGLSSVCRSGIPDKL
jgi:hypothetical protein